MNLARRMSLVAALCAIAHAGTPSAEAVAAAPQIERIDYATRVAPTFRKFCGDCHFDGAEEGDLPLDKITATLDPAADHFKWLSVWKNLRAQTMPPSDAAQPSDAERDAAVRWIEQSVFQLDPSRPDPGRVTVRRLNRTEYANTIRDLTGVEFNTLEAFPADDTGYGFDVIGDVLNISPLLMEKYVEAAQSIAARATKEGSRSTKVYLKASSGESTTSKEYLRRILRDFARRAFRRPVDEALQARIGAAAERALDGPQGNFDRAVALGMTLVLSSPRFLFRVETVLPSEPGTVGAPIDEYALASRLSYFLWSTMPDAELIRLADENRLRAELRPQVDRMLDDAKSDQFVKNFVGQWLQTRDVETLSVDARRLLGVDRETAQKIFTRDLRRAMRQETELLFEYLLAENRPVVELLTADYTFLNATLAKFYGIDGVKSKDMKRVELDNDDHRGGLLTQASFLLVTSNPTRTSPVKRGLFILENLLGTPAPPPPADVPPLEESQNAKKKLSMREALELHRREPLCNSCHARMDPLGLALEEFNGLGLWREKEDGKKIETGGKLITGEKFGNVRELSHVIAEKRTKDLYRCVTEKLLTYALGRGVEYYDAPAVDRIVADLGRDGRTRTLIYGIVESAPFQLRRHE